ncbi:transmembrane protein [Perilla frutescens var. frutescens]|nr:transmembrane protein [Perilla frutescens var. frutescens]
MARAAILHLLRSQSASFNSGNHLSKVGSWAHTLRSKTDANPAVQFSNVHRRFLSRSAAAVAADENKINTGSQKRGEEENDEKDYGVVYHGPISNTIKKVKLLSLSTCCLSVSLGPIVTFMTSSASNVILKGAVASTVIFLSASTTGALHWFVSPYVHKLRWQPGSDSFEVEMMSWLATYIPKTIKFEDIRPPETNRPFVSFKANGNFYYVDAEHCDNKALLAKLTPQKQARESPFRNL